MNAKPWQMAVIGLGLLIGLGSVIFWTTRSSGPEVPTRFLLVDVTTGEVFRTDRQVVLPALHPETREPRLFVLSQENGQYLLSERQIQAIRQSMRADESLNPTAVDLETGVLKVEVGNIKTYRMPD